MGYFPLLWKNHPLFNFYISSIINLERSYKFIWTEDYSTMYSLHRIQKWFVENCRTIKIVKMTQGCMVCHFTFRSSSIFVVIQTAKCRHVHFIGFNSGMNNKKTRFNAATFGYILSGRYERERSLKSEFYCLQKIVTWQRNII